MRHLSHAEPSAVSFGPSILSFLQPQTNGQPGQCLARASGGGGSSASSGVYQADWSAGTQFRLRSPDVTVTRSHAGLFCGAAATELCKSGCIEMLLSVKILLTYFCLIFPMDCQLVVEAQSVIISV